MNLNGGSCLLPKETTTTNLLIFIVWLLNLCRNLIGQTGSGTVHKGRLWTGQDVLASYFSSPRSAINTMWFSVFLKVKFDVYAMCHLACLSMLLRVRLITQYVYLLGFQEFIVEILILSLLHHFNLVTLIGYCTDGDQMKDC